MDLYKPVEAAANLTAEQDLQFVEDILGQPDNYVEAVNAHLEKAKKYLRNSLNRALKHFNVPVPRGTKMAGKMKLFKAHLAARNDFDEETRQRMAGDLMYLEFAVAEYKRVLKEYRRLASQEFTWLSPVVDLGDLLVHAGIELEETLSTWCEGYSGEAK